MHRVCLLLASSVAAVPRLLPEDAPVTPTPTMTPLPIAVPFIEIQPTPTPTPDAIVPAGIEPTDPDDCICCERSLAAMTRYCKAEMPMGDLGMKNFDCAKEMGTEITFNNEGSHQRWTAINSCKCDCEKRLADLKASTCPMGCKKLPFACPICAPPPPPPAPPPAPPLGGFGSSCRPVSVPCCEAMMEALEKYCFSFKPEGVVVKIPDTTHWDGGIWQQPASFEMLCEQYSPPECGECAMACQRTLQNAGRQYHPNLCDAVKECSGFCDNQCPGNNATSLQQIVADAVKSSYTMTLPQAEQITEFKTMQQQQGQ